MLFVRTVIEMVVEFAYNYVRSDSPYNPRSDLQCDNLEAVWTDVLLPRSKPILIGAVYRPEGTPQFLENFENLL